MMKNWYNKINNKINNEVDNWYMNSQSYDIPRCMACNEYIITPTGSDIDMCDGCLQEINKRLTSKVAALIEKNKSYVDFVCDHIPDFSIITASFENNDIITIGMDWDEVVISDVIIENYDDSLLKANKLKLDDVEEDLISFIISLGDVMYPDLFDRDALKAKDDKLNSLISKLCNKNKKVIAWKAVDNSIYNEWKDKKIIPKGIIFSLPDYYYMERNGGVEKDSVLMKLSTDRKNIIRRRNSTIELKTNLGIDCVRAIKNRR